MSSLSIQDAREMANLIAESNLVPGVDTEARAWFLIQLGSELGLTPAQAVRSFHIVDGRPILSADVAVALVLKSGKCQDWRITAASTEAVTVVTKRDDVEHVQRYSIEDARRAGLVDGPKGTRANWAKYPVDMLYHRCASKLIARVYPDVLFGCVDSPVESESTQVAAPAVSVEAVRDHLRRAEVQELQAPATIVAPPPTESEPTQVPAPALAEVEKIAASPPEPPPEVIDTGFIRPVIGKCSTIWVARITACDTIAELNEIIVEAKDAGEDRQTLRELYAEQKKVIQSRRTK